MHLVRTQYRYPAALPTLEGWLTFLFRRKKCGREQFFFALLTPYPWQTMVFKIGSLVAVNGLRNEVFNGKIARIVDIVSPAGTQHELFRVEVLLVEEIGHDVNRNILVKEGNMVVVCFCCHTSEAQLFCGKCRVATYCNRECQKRGWTQHKENCAALAIQRMAQKSPLYAAAAIGDLRVVQQLVSEGANLNKADTLGGTPLFVSCMSGHLSVVRFLVENGADIERPQEQGWTPLCIAAENGHLSTVKYLIEKGASKETANDQGATPLFAACMHGKLEAAQYLVEQGANLDVCNIYGATLLTAASDGGHLRIVQYLIERGRCLNECEIKCNSTSLFLAVSRRHLEVVRLLVSLGADMHIRNSSGAAPLHVACENGDLLIMRFLLQNGGLYTFIQIFF